ncbi:hypothetical protein ACAG96_06830 [Candidatus Izemoplasma sp. B36]|uniref:hypothetical protein n=1 Tax=Candidatus Izemoplasma sp. B36 TaxID=3242468 RepID=UPI003556AFF0
MLNILLYTQCVLAIIVTGIVLRKSNKIHVIVHSIFNGIVILVYLTLTFYYPFINTYLNYGLYALILLLIIEVAFLIHNKESYTKIIHTTFNALVISSVFNIIVFLTIKITPNVNYLIQLGITVVLIVIYGLYQKFINCISFERIGNFRSVWVILVFLLVLPLCIVKTDIDYNDSLHSDNHHSLILNDPLIINEVSSLYYNEDLELFDILYTDKYVYYVQGENYKKILYKYDIYNNTQEVFLETNDLNNGAYKYIDICLYGDQIYILTNSGLYYMENDELVTIFSREFNEFNIENSDYFHALYTEDCHDTDPESLLYYITESDRYIVNGTTLTLDNEGYDPNALIRSTYEDEVIIDMYKFSHDLCLYNVIISESGTKFETSYLSATVSYNITYDVRAELFSDYSGDYYIITNDINSIVLEGISFEIESDIEVYTDYLTEIDFISDTKYSITLNPKNYVSFVYRSYLKEYNDDYYIIYYIFRGDGNHLSTVYKLEIGNNTLNNMTTFATKNVSSWFSLIVLFIPLLSMKKKDE